MSNNRNKVGIHLECVWQTSSVSDNEELYHAINLFLTNGFKVSYINWHARGYACKAERLNSIAVNYDGKVFKCTGRSYIDEHCDGELCEDGEIKWKPGRLEKRLGNTTFENPKCLDCKMLPVCMGPCSQKLMERDWDNIEQICTLNTLELEMKKN